MSPFGFLFSIQGFLTLLFFSLFLFILRDYPRWKTGSRPEKPSVQAVTTHDASLTQYILVTPFAAIYVIGRLILDTIRYSVYYGIWFLEKSWPHLDDWLFEAMTVRLPQKLNQIQRWWTEVGQPTLRDYQAHFSEHTAPRILQALEKGGLMVYRFGCAVQSIAQTFATVWRRFAASHIWKQLAEDLGEATFGVVVALWRLISLAYRGCHQAALSIKEDLICLATAIPPILDRVFSVLQWIFAKLQIMIGPMIWVKKNLISPTLGRALVFCIKGIDHLLLLIQTNSHRIEKIYRFLLPQTVWLLTDIVQNGTYSAIVIERLYQEVKPVFLLFVKYVLPRLSAGYRKLRDSILIWLSPAWSYMIPYIQSIAAPIIIGIQTAFSQLFSSLWFFIPFLQSAFTQCISWIAVCANQTYLIAQQWLTKQAPVLSLCLQKIYDCNWQGWNQAVTQTTSEIYLWISEQLQLVYASLERSLTTWVDEKK